MCEECGWETNSSPKLVAHATSFQERGLSMADQDDASNTPPAGDAAVSPPRWHNQLLHGVACKLMQAYVGWLPMPRFRPHQSHQRLSLARLQVCQCRPPRSQLLRH